MSIGGALYQGNSGLVAGPLGVVKVGYNGYDMGKTTSEAMLDVVQNIKDIVYQQDGSMPSDKVRTGIIYQLKVTFGEISTGLLAQIMNGFEQASTDPNADAAVITRSMYESQRDNEAAPLRIAKVDANGVESDLDKDVLNFYIAIANVDGTLINWGADTQRGVSVVFDIYWYVFGVGESTAYDGAFGYYGDPTAADVPAVVWPDRIGPYPLSAAASAATALKITMSEDMVLVGGVTLEDQIVITVEGIFVVPTTAVIGTDPSDDEIDLTLPAASISAGDVVKLFITAACVEDASGNDNGAWNEFAVTNSVT